VIEEWVSLITSSLKFALIMPESALSLILLGSVEKYLHFLSKYLLSVGEANMYLEIVAVGILIVGIIGSIWDVK
jgi:hypothetical protein